MACKDYRLRSRIRAKLAPAREFACLKPRPYDGNSFVVTVVVQHAGPVMKRGFGDEWVRKRRSMPHPTVVG